MDWLLLSIVVVLMVLCILLWVRFAISRLASLVPVSGSSVRNGYTVCPEMANWTSLLQITPLHEHYAIVYYSMYNILVHAILSSARCLSVPSSIDE